MKIAVAGTGYAGLVTAVCLAKIGHTVTCVDVDKEKINMLKKLKCPIYEDGLEELMIQCKNYGYKKIINFIYNDISYSFDIN